MRTAKDRYSLVYNQRINRKTFKRQNLPEINNAK